MKCIKAKFIGDNEAKLDFTPKGVMGVIWQRLKLDEDKLEKNEYFDEAYMTIEIIENKVANIKARYELEIEDEIRTRHISNIIEIDGKYVRWVQLNQEEGILVISFKETYDAKQIIYLFECDYEYYEEFDE